MGRQSSTSCKQRGPDKAMTCHALFALENCVDVTCIERLERLELARRRTNFSTLALPQALLVTLVNLGSNETVVKTRHRHCSSTLSLCRPIHEAAHMTHDSLEQFVLPRALVPDMH